MSQTVHASEKQNTARKDRCSVCRGDDLHIHTSPGTLTFLLPCHGSLPVYPSVLLIDTGGLLCGRVYSMQWYSVCSPYVCLYSVLSIDYYSSIWRFAAVSLAVSIDSGGCSSNSAAAARWSAAKASSFMSSADVGC